MRMPRWAEYEGNGGRSKLGKVGSAHAYYSHSRGGATWARLRLVLGRGDGVGGGACRLTQSLLVWSRRVCVRACVFACGHSSRHQPLSLTGGSERSRSF